MKVVVFGANGNVGSRVVSELLDRGHTVTASVHDKSMLASHKNLTIVHADIYDAGSVGKAVSDSHAVISALGSWGTPNKDILTKGMANIISAMQAVGIKRVISLTGADARDTDDKLSLIHRCTYRILNLLAKKILHDGEEHIRLLRSSQLEWTVVRSPVMNNKGGGEYKLSSNRPMPWATINRQSVAIAMVHELTEPRFIQQSPFISRT